MCGLYGYSTKKNANLTKSEELVRNKILTGLAVAMQERGSHSTGVAGICSKPCKKHSWRLFKQAIEAREFVQTPDYKKFMKHSPRVVIGHTRYATVGSITNENSHPFVEGNIIGAHNGHVSNYAQIHSDADVDSQAIFYALNEADNDPQVAFEKLYGQFAITWFDQRDLKKVNLVVDGNPLSIVYVKELNTYFWCSLERPLEAILASHFDIGKLNIWSPKSSTVYTINSNNQISRKNVEFKKTYTYSSNTSCSTKDTAKTGKIVDDDDEEEKELAMLNAGRYEDNIYEIVRLSDADLKKIWETANCYFCQKAFDFDNDEMWWHRGEKEMLCVECGYTYENWTQYLVLEPDDWVGIEGELDYREQLNSLTQKQIDIAEQAEISAIVGQEEERYGRSG